MARTAVPAPPLTSLTRAGGRQGAPCSSCGSDRVTRIAMTLTDGTPVDFAHCLHCETRTWEEAGAPLSLAGVLSKATKRR